MEMTRNVRKVAAGVAKNGIELAGKEALSLARTAWLVGLGAAATAGEAGVAAFESLVEKGRRRSESPVEKAERAIRQTGREAAKLVETTGRAVYRQATDILEQIGVPTEADIRALKSRVEALRARLT